MLRSSIIVFLVVCTSLHSLSGQDVNISLTAPGIVAVGEQIQVTYTVNSDDGKFTAPQFDGFYLLMGPSTSFSKQYSIINGRRESVITNSFSYYLQATSVGKYAIAPATYTVKNRVYSSDSLIIEVVKDGSAKQSTARSSTDRTASSGEQVYIRLIPARTQVYVGEALPLSLKLFTRQNIEGLGEESFPDFKGFMKEDVTIPPLQQLKEENVGGITYGTGVYRQFVVYPQSRGKLVIDPAKLTVFTRQQRASNADQFFNDPFFNDVFGGFANVPKVLATLPIEIEVRELPDNAPVGFSGAIGSFTTSLSASTETIKANEAVTIKFQLKGTGNLRLAGAPYIAFPAGIEAYDPKVNISSENGVNGPAGTKTFEYLIIPRTAGTYTIPGITYSYFEPSTDRYITTTTQPIRIDVALSAEGDSNGLVMISTPLKSDLQILGRDIRHIKDSNGRSVSTDTPLASSIGFILLYPAILVLGAALFLVAMYNRKRRGDTRRVKQQKAAKIATKRLKKAEKLLQSDSKEAFYDAILSSLWGYLSDKLGIPLSALNRSQVLLNMREQGVSQMVEDALTGIIDQAEFYRYAPGSQSADREKILEKAKELIRTIEETI